jgi:hypothetical protein
LRLSLYTAGFIAALDRFIGHRGLPQTIWSDNGTNFFNISIRCIKKIAGTIANKSITWHFIPASSPHFGELWEARVKSIKHHLRWVLEESTLTLEELSMVHIQFEACLNSKPLCPLSSDINNLEILTPGHFTIGRALLARPNPDCTETKLGPLNGLQNRKTLLR